MKIILNSNELSCSIAESAVEAISFRERLMGLMFRKGFGEIDAMVFPDCRSIHTFFMHFPIDLICLDSSNYVIALCCGLQRSRTFIGVSEITKIIELPTGAIKESGAKVGDKVEFVENAPN
jgi:uncharacterized protein